MLYIPYDSSLCNCSGAPALTQRQFRKVASQLRFILNEPKENEHEAAATVSVSVVAGSKRKAASTVRISKRLRVSVSISMCQLCALTAVFFDR